MDEPTNLLPDTVVRQAWQWQDLVRGQCRFELSGTDPRVKTSDFRFCGAPVEEDCGYWCPTHRAIVYRPWFPGRSK